MTRFRFSIASLLGLVLFVAIAIAALRAASDVWDSILFSTTLGLLLFAALLAVHRKGRRRAFWLGFALFGSAYLGASLLSPMESRLITTRGLSYLDSKVPMRNGFLRLRLSLLNNSGNQNLTLDELALLTDGQSQTSTTLGVIGLWDAATGKLLSSSGGTSENFMRIGHCLIALMLAFLGAKLSRYLCVSVQESRRDEMENFPLSAVEASIHG